MKGFLFVLGLAAFMPSILMANENAQIEAKLIPPTKPNPNDLSRTVEVDVKGVDIVHAAKAKEEPKKGQGHLHYQLDSNPTVATTSKKLSFYGLTPGQHVVKVSLAGNDHQPLGPSQQVRLHV